MKRDRKIILYLCFVAHGSDEEGLENYPVLPLFCSPLLWWRGIGTEASPCPSSRSPVSWLTPSSAHSRGETPAERLPSITTIPPSTSASTVASIYSEYFIWMFNIPGIYPWRFKVVDCLSFRYINLTERIGGKIFTISVNSFIFQFIWWKSHLPTCQIGEIKVHLPLLQKSYNKKWVANLCVICVLLDLEKYVCLLTLFWCLPFLTCFDVCCFTTYFVCVLYVNRLTLCVYDLDMSCMFIMLQCVVCVYLIATYSMLIILPAIYVCLFL